MLTQDPTHASTLPTRPQDPPRVAGSDRTDVYLHAPRRTPVLQRVASVDRSVAARIPLGFGLALDRRRHRVYVDFALRLPRPRSAFPRSPRLPPRKVSVMGAGRCWLESASLLLYSLHGRSTGRF